MDMITPERMNQLNEAFRSSDVLEENGSVEVSKDGKEVTITFAVQNDWSLRSIRLIYDGEIDSLNMLCLLYELAKWLETPRRKRSLIGDVLKQYRGHLTDPKIYIQTHVI